MKKQTVKSIIFSFVFLIISFLFWYSLSVFFQKIIVVNIIKLVVIFWLWGAVLGIYCLLIKEKLIFYSTFLLAVFSFFVAFPFNKYYFIALFLLFSAMIWGRRMIIKELDNHLKISIGKTARSTFSLILFFVFLLASVIYYFQPSINLNEFKIPHSLFKVAEKQLEGIINKTFPITIIKGMSINQISTIDILQKEGKLEKILLPLTRKIPKEKLENISLEDLLKAAGSDPEIQKMLKEEIDKEARKISPSLLEKHNEELAKGFGLTDIKGDESVDQALYDFVNQKVNLFIGPYKNFIPLILAIILFFILESLLFIIRPLVILGIRLLFKILFWAKFIRIKIILKESEALEI